MQNISWKIWPNDRGFKRYIQKCFVTCKLILFIISWMPKLLKLTKWLKIWKVEYLKNRWHSLVQSQQVNMKGNVLMLWLWLWTDINSLNLVEILLFLCQHFEISSVLLLSRIRFDSEFWSDSIVSVFLSSLWSLVFTQWSYMLKSAAFSCRFVKYVWSFSGHQGRKS